MSRHHTYLCKGRHGGETESITAMMENINFKVIDKIENKGQIYLLLSMYENTLLPEASVPNVIAIDKSGNLIWAIEAPTTNFDIYSKIYFKDNNFFALTSAGQLHQIDWLTGKIIGSEMIK